MRNSVDALLASALPVPEWGVFAVAMLLFALNHVAAQRARAEYARQSVVSFGRSENWERALQPKYIGAQVAYAVLVFVFAAYLGGPFFVFIGGGYVVMLAFSLAFNVQGLLFAHALHETKDANGRIEFGPRLSLHQSSYRLFAGAIACLVTGALVMHLALLGGAVWLASVGAGYLRRAREPHDA